MYPNKFILSQLDSHVGNAPFGYMLFTLDEFDEPVLLYVNNTVLNYTGFTFEECINQNKIEILKEDSVKQIIKDVALDGIKIEVKKYVNQFQKSFDMMVYSIQPRVAIASIKDNTNNFLYQNALYNIAPEFNAIYYINLDKDNYKTVYPFNMNSEGKYSSLINELFDYKVHPEDRINIINKTQIRSLINDINKYGQVEYKYRVLGISGNYEWHKAGFVAIDTETPRLEAVTLSIRSIDVIEQQEIQKKKELEEALQIAKDASKAKTTFLSTMSHDIRTPLNVILGMTKIAKNNLDNKKRLEDVLSKIETSGKHLLTLINEVLDMSKIESGNIELLNTEFLIPSLMSDILDMIEGVVSTKKQSLHFEANDVIHESVIGDQIRLQQILINIVGNASKYTNNFGSINISLSELECNREGYGLYQFVIQDNGIGMSKDYISRVFDPFSREVDSRVSKIEGTGLGMSIALNLIKLMNGRINIESEQGVGTTVKIEIPLKYQDVKIEYNTFSDQNILVIDDFESSAETITSMLHELKANAEYTDTCYDGLNKLKDNKYTMLIVDYMMPEMNGIQFANLIREKINKDLPIILVTGYDNSKISDDAYLNNINCILSKPIFKSNLVNALNNVLQENKPEVYPQLNLNALLVEDNDLNVEIAVEFMKLLGIKADIANDGLEGYNRFKASKYNEYDCIFMDVEMPVMNGIEATKAIRALDREDAKNIPIFTMTANAFSNDVEYAFENGVTDYIPKPISFTAFTNVLTKWFK